MTSVKCKVSLKLWINQEEKIISFHEMPGWTYRCYQKKEDMTCEVEQFVTDNYRFQ